MNTSPYGWGCGDNSARMSIGWDDIRVHCLDSTPAKLVEVMKRTFDRAPGISVWYGPATGTIRIVFPSSVDAEMLGIFSGVVEGVVDSFFDRP